jgi:hypothetical protein
LGGIIHDVQSLLSEFDFVYSDEEIGGFDSERLSVAVKDRAGSQPTTAKKST